MPANFDREPAKIYAFPVNGRLAFAGERKATEPTAPFATAAVSKTKFGDGWYHDAAIADAELTRRR